MKARTKIHVTPRIPSPTHEDKDYHNYGNKHSHGNTSSSKHPKAMLNNNYSSSHPTYEPSADEEPSLTNSSVSYAEYEDELMPSTRHSHNSTPSHRRNGSASANVSASDINMDMDTSRLHSSLLDHTHDSGDEEEYPHDETFDLDESMDIMNMSTTTTSEPEKVKKVNRKKESMDHSLVDTVSESLTESFCNAGAGDNSWSLSDCNSYLPSSTCPNNNSATDSNSSKMLMSDYILQNRLLEDFHYLLGSTTLPCLEEKNLYLSCFHQDDKSTHRGDDLFQSIQQERFNPSTPNKREIRNRARESWRARAYRIKKLREGSMLSDTQNPLHPSFSSLSINGPHPHLSASIQPQPFKNGSNPLVYSYSVDGGSSPNVQSHTLSKQQMNHSSNMNVRQNQCGIEYPICRSSSPIRTPRNTKSQSTKQANPDPLGCIIGDCIEPISHINHESGDLKVEVVWKQLDEYAEEQDYCYDSDPGQESSRDLTSLSQSMRDVRLNQSTTAADSGESFVATGTATENGGYNVVRSGSTPTKATSGRRPGVVKKIVGSGPLSSLNRAIPLKRRRRMHFDSVGDEAAVSESLHTVPVDDVEEGPIVEEEDYEERGWNGGELPMETKQLSMQDHELQTDVQEALNRTWTLTWHPQSNEASKTVERTSPRIIQLWLERGNRIRANDIVEPKMMWRDTLQPNSMAGSRQILRISAPQSSSSSDVGVGNKSAGGGTSGFGVGSATGIGGGPYQVCLLSICRVLETSSLPQGIDRKKYPFAKTSCSIILRTCNDQEFLFEARNERERDRIVYLWKLVVARLASQAVVGDSDGMVQEYFVPTSFGVPGEFAI